MNLIIGFEKKNKITYPHLFQTVLHFTDTGRYRYFHFHERGYFTDDTFKITGENLLKLRVVRLFGKFFIDCARLLLLKINSRYEHVVAVDNLAYTIACMFFKNVTLWSHDFVTLDQARSCTFYQIKLNQRTTKNLLAHKKIVIQSTSRAELFFNTHHLTPGDASVFYFPVSLFDLETTPQPTEPNAKPKLLQIGGINKWRSNSHMFLAHYQTHSADYELMFHGFFDSEMKQEIKNATLCPLCNQTQLPPDQVHHVIEKCDIGIISYNVQNLNFFYIAHASGQFVEFLRLGKPVIVLGENELGSFVSQHSLGVQIKSILRLSVAIETVMNNFTKYSYNCRLMFKEQFDIDIYLSQLTSWIEI